MDLSGATTAGFEIIDINANNVTLDESAWRADCRDRRNWCHNRGNIMATLDLSDLQLASTVGFTANYASTRCNACLSKIAITGSDGADTIQGGSGDDTIIAGDGGDTIVLH